MRMRETLGVTAREVMTEYLGAARRGDWDTAFGYFAGRHRHARPGALGIRRRAARQGRRRRLHPDRPQPLRGRRYSARLRLPRTTIASRRSCASASTARGPPSRSGARTCTASRTTGSSRSDLRSRPVRRRRTLTASAATPMKTPSSSILTRSRTLRGSDAPGEFRRLTDVLGNEQRPVHAAPCAPLILISSRAPGTSTTRSRPCNPVTPVRRRCSRLTTRAHRSACWLPSGWRTGCCGRTATRAMKPVELWAVGEARPL